MNILALSTAEQGGSLAVVNDDQLIANDYWDVKMTHSKRLLPMIEKTVKDRCRMDLDHFDLLVAAKGPGSFTGLRIGVSVIKGLSLAIGKPSAGASSLDGIAYRLQYASLPICVMMDARRGEVYTAIYNFENGHLMSKTAEIVCRPETILLKIKGPAIFAGSGSKAYSDLIEDKIKDAVITDPYNDGVCAAALLKSIRLPADDFKASDFPLEPVYLRKSDAELNFKQ